MSSIKIKDLPKVTKASFEKFVEEHTTQIQYDEYHFVGIEKPKNSQEFREFTKKVYGVSLDVDCFVYPDGSFSNYTYTANYKVRGNQSEYDKKGLMPLWEEKFGQYDGLKVLLDWCFGDVFCGGVASSHYGQTKVPTKKDYERIKNWGDNDRNLTKARIDQHNSLVGIFGHNPFI